VACALVAVPKQPGIGSQSAWFAVLGMFAGVAGCVFLSVLIGRSRVLEYVGRHSIVFYALNALMLNAAKLAVFRALHVNGAALPAAGQWAIGVIVTVLAMLFMAVADLFVQRWMWWSIGEAKPAGRRVRGAHVGGMQVPEKTLTNANLILITLAQACQNAKHSLCEQGFGWRFVPRACVFPHILCCPSM
jgi:uncharacterized membrane protein